MAKQNKQKNTQNKELRAEMQQKKKKFTKAAFALIIVGIIFIVVSGAFYSSAPNLYQLLQTMCYFLICLGGITFAYCSKYEEDKQKKSSVQTIGLIFIIVAGGRLLAMFFNAMR